MDMLDTVRVIGFFEAGTNLVDVNESSEVNMKVGAKMPLPDKNIKQNIEKYAEWILGFDKNEVMYLTPEIALIEAIERKKHKVINHIIALPCDLDSDTKERINNNLPKDANVTVLEEPFFPQNFFPGNGLIVISGYSGGGRSMVMHDTYRMIEHYGGFLGKKVFVPYRELDVASRYDGWMEVNPQRVSEKWRAE